MPEFTKTARAWMLTPETRELFQFIIPEPIPINITRVITKEDGYLLMTAEEWSELTDGAFILPRFTMFSYTDFTYQD